MELHKHGVSRKGEEEAKIGDSGGGDDGSRHFLLERSSMTMR